MKYGIIFNEEDCIRIDMLLKYCELDSVDQLMGHALDTMFDVIGVTEGDNQEAEVNI